MSTNFAKAVLITALLVLFSGIVMGAAAGEGDPNLAVNNQKKKVYTVQEGDNLSKIAEKTGVSVPALIRANRLSSTVIYPRQVLIIPGSDPDFGIAISRGFTREDVMLLARAIYAEARGESFTGQVAVGAVVLNRMESRDFPRTIRDVIMQRQSGTYQFSPVKDGSINLEPDETAICAAIQAMAGHDPTNGALYFYNPETASDCWIKTLPIVARIGNHVFASKI
ncbi:MAG: cell wall hydrolase [Peptococcaceae bacterium]|nr:cell wall hydrolase [Peptococcaceae bacterium]